MPKGFLAVLSEPGQVAIDEFHDWYNNEHVPLRLNHLPSFLTGARYTAVDGRKPGWIALYDIDSTATFSDPSYTRLRENRSSREAALVKRLDVLDRRTCEVVLESENEKLIGETQNTGLAVGNPTQIVLTHGIDISKEEGRSIDETISETWQRILAAAKEGEGVLRSRLFRCIDGLKTGVTITPGSDTKIPEYFVLHELSSQKGMDALRTRLDKLKEGKQFVISEEREWQIYRAYPSIAQGNITLSS